MHFNILRQATALLSDHSQDRGLLGSPTLSSEVTEHVSIWTPGCSSTYFSDSVEEEEKEAQSIVAKFNQALENLSDLAGVDKPPLLSHQLDDLESATSMEKHECTDMATDACRVICSIIAPNDGEELHLTLYHVQSLMNTFYL